LVWHLARWLVVTQPGEVAMCLHLVYQLTHQESARRLLLKQQSEMGEGDLCT
jgi:hypothetical protein